MRRGEVWWVEFDPAVGSEIRKTRPAVIVSNDAANRNLSRARRGLGEAVLYQKTAEAIRDRYKLALDWRFQTRQRAYHLEMADMYAQRIAALIRESGLPATILRPWYVLGPGHRWPVLLTPLYALAEVLPPTREGARRLGLVTLDQMLAALVAAVEAPADGWRSVDVPQIRRSIP